MIYIRYMITTIIDIKSKLFKKNNNILTITIL